MPYIPPHLRQGYVPSAPATAEMLGINTKSQMIRPNIAQVPFFRTTARARQFQLPPKYQNTIELHRRRESYKKHRGHHHVSKSRKRSKSRTTSRR